MESGLLFNLAKPLVESIQLSLKTLGENASDVPLEERDLPINYVFIAILLMLSTYILLHILILFHLGLLQLYYLLLCVSLDSYSLLLLLIWQE